MRLGQSQNVSASPGTAAHCGRGPKRVCQQTASGVCICSALSGKSVPRRAVQSAPPRASKERSARSCRRADADAIAAALSDSPTGITFDSRALPAKRPRCDRELLIERLQRSRITAGCKNPSVPSHHTVIEAGPGTPTDAGALSSRMLNSNVTSEGSRSSFSAAMLRTSLHFNGEKAGRYGRGVLIASK